MGYEGPQCSGNATPCHDNLWMAAVENIVRCTTGKDLQGGLLVDLLIFSVTTSSEGQEISVAFAHCLW
jgi:hypothetical protein